MENIREITTCRLCGSEKLVSILSLGELYVSNFVDVGETSGLIKAPLELVLCDTHAGGCGLLQLRHTVPAEALYRTYWYRSGVNRSMTDELADIAEKIEKVIPLTAGDRILDIGSNDGTLLRAYQTSGLQLVGFEPARNLEEMGKQGIAKLFVDFFNFSAWQKEFGAAKAKVITAIAMFYDLDDPNAFVADIERCLDDEGLLVIQMMYVPSFLKRNAFDGICHEHLEYYSLLSLENLLKRHRLEVFDVEMREHVNEGSIRVYVKKARKGNSLRPFAGADGRVREFHAEEERLGLENREAYEALAKRIVDTKDKITAFIREEVAKGKKIHGYAASTKGNTTLQFYGLTPALIEAIADRNPVKWGKFTVGTMIPVISEEESRARKPDYYFVLAWHFLPEFISREAEFLKKGGKFIVPMPEFKVIGSEDVAQ
jgi:SAM-dependent methyltransferase